MAAGGRKKGKTSTSLKNSAQKGERRWKDNNPFQNNMGKVQAHGIEG